MSGSFGVGASGTSPPRLETVSVVTRSEKSRPEPGTEHTALYLTPAQAAELLQVSEKTLTRWSLADASMPVIRRGRVVRFHRGRFLDWLQRQEPRAARQRQSPATAQGQRKAPGTAA